MRYNQQKFTVQYLEIKQGCWVIMNITFEELSGIFLLMQYTTESVGGKNIHWFKQQHPCHRSRSLPWKFWRSGRITLTTELDVENKRKREPASEDYFGRSKITKKIPTKSNKDKKENTENYN